MWRLSRTSDPASDIKIVDVAICSMRKRLEKFGIEIITLWGLRLPALEQAASPGHGPHPCSRAPG